jgi:CheY-like chemotaxis protein
VTERPTKGRDPDLDLAGALHDVSNVLTVLLGWIAEARAPEATAETIGRALTIIEERARVARDLARHAIGGAPASSRTTAGAIATDVIAALRVEAERAGTVLTMQGSACDAVVDGAIDLAQVLTNLLLNALAFAPRETEITLDVSSDGTHVTMVVADHGPGVAPEHRASIFRGESRRPGGTGIGLRRSRDLARAFGGDVTLLPSSSAAGARFELSWARADVAPRPAASSRAHDFDGLRILVVEDDPAVTELLETALEARGAIVTVARTSAELSVASQKATYAAALVDLSPIAADPAAAVAMLERTSPGIDLLVISGSADRLPAALSDPRFKIVRKPFEPSEVFAALAGLSQKEP